MRRSLQIISVLFALFMLFLGYTFWSDYDAALIMSNHQADSMGNVLAGRFVAVAALGFFAAWHRDLTVTIFAFGVFAWLGIADGLTYMSQGLPFLPHMITGLIALAVAVFAVAAKRRQGDASM